MYNLTQFKSIESLQEFLISEELYEYIYPLEWLYTMTDDEYEHYTDKRRDELYLVLESHCVDMGWNNNFQLP